MSTLPTRNLSKQKRFLWQIPFREVLDKVGKKSLTIILLRGQWIWFQHALYKFTKVNLIKKISICYFFFFV